MIRCALIELFLPGGGFALRGDLRAAAIDLGVLVAALALCLVVPWGFWALVATRLAAPAVAAWMGRRGPAGDDWRWRAMVLVGSIGFGLLLLTRVFVLEPFRVPTDSMEPTIHHGDRIIVDKLSLRFRAPRRGEVIAFRMGGKTFVKRVIAFGGEHVSVSEGVVRVNEIRSVHMQLPPLRGNVMGLNGTTRRFEEEFAGHHFETFALEEWSEEFHDNMQQAYPRDGRCGEDRAGNGTKLPTYEVSDRTCVVPAGTVFVMGDNRVNSADSRYIGAIPVEWVFGRAVGVD